MSASALILKQPKRIARVACCRVSTAVLGGVYLGKGGDRVSASVPVPLLLLCKKMKYFLPSTPMEHFLYFINRL